MLIFLVLVTKPVKATKTRPTARNQFDSGANQNTRTGGVMGTVCLFLPFNVKRKRKESLFNIKYNYSKCKN